MNESSPTVPVLEKTVDPTIAHFHEVCEQLINRPIPENASPELKAEMLKTKSLVTDIKEKMGSLASKSVDWLKEKGMKIFDRTKKYLPALAIVTGATLAGSTASYFSQEGSHTDTVEILKNMTLMIGGLITSGAGLYKAINPEENGKEATNI
jgi:hypothetical protein